MSASKPAAVYKEAVDNLNRLGIEALVVLGGEGTLGIAQEFDKLGIPVVGVPKTIDNDLACTELTFGFITALDIATDALDRLHTTAESHERVMILEVMGRHTGWIALHSGIAGGADVILIPEIPFTMQSVADRIRARDAAGSNFSIIVAAEGALETGHELIYQDKGDRQHAPRLGGIGAYCQRCLEELTGKETRCVVLGHLQRGGRPNAFDRMLATNYGSCAVRAVVDGKRGVMVALQAGDVITVPICQAIANVKTVPADGQLVRTARDTGISFGAPMKQLITEQIALRTCLRCKKSERFNCQQTLKQNFKVNWMSSNGNCEFTYPKRSNARWSLAICARTPNIARRLIGKMWSRRASWSCGNASVKFLQSTSQRFRGIKPVMDRPWFCSTARKMKRSLIVWSLPKKAIRSRV